MRIVSKIPKSKKKTSTHRRQGSNSLLAHKQPKRYDNNQSISIQQLDHHRATGVPCNDNSACDNKIFSSKAELVLNETFGILLKH